MSAIFPSPSIFAGVKCRVGVDVVDYDGIDTNRCEKTSILAGAGEVCYDGSVGKEDRVARKATFDAAIQVVPSEIVSIASKLNIL